MGFIYEITCNITGECYYGQSNLPKQLRLNSHKCKSNECASKQIIERGNYIFKIIEENIEKEKLKEREYFYITNNACINKNIPYLNEDNRIKRNLDRMKKMYENEEYKNKKIEYSKNRYQNNKDAINNKKKEKMICECGGCFRKSDKRRHVKSQKHQNYLLSINNI